MGRVIGPIEATGRERFADWFTMREIRSSIRWSQETDPVKYANAINGFKETYKAYLKNYAVSN